MRERPERIAVSDILERGAALVFRRVGLFLRIGAPLVLPANALLILTVLVFDRLSPEGAGAYPAIAVVVLVSIAYVAALALAIGACVRAAADVKARAVTSARGAYAVVRERVKPFFALALILFAAIAPGVVLYAIARTHESFAVLAIVPIAVALVLTTIWSVAVPALLVENAGVAAALERSRTLVRGRFMHALGSVFFGSILALFAGVMALILISFIPVEDSSARFSMGLAGWALGELIAVPLLAAYATVLYDGLLIYERGSGLAPPAAASR